RMGLSGCSDSAVMTRPRCGGLDLAPECTPQDCAKPLTDPSMNGTRLKLAAVQETIPMSEADTTSVASGARGPGRRPARPAQPVRVIAGVRRQIPTYDLLSEEGLVSIEAAIDEILKEIGLDFRGDPAALELWRKAGADVKGERVRFDPGLVRDIVKRTTPSSF